MTPAPAVAEQPQGKAWHSQSAEEVLARLASTSEGLSSHEAAQRLTTNGLNELKEGKSISPLQIFLGQFKSLIIWILIAAGVISGLLGERVDAIAILAIVILNAVIGFYQEFKAEKSIAALKELTAPQARVRRDGQVTSISASGIVAGDILALEAGDLVAADARLLEAASLRCIEAPLTGESDAVKKQTATLEQGHIPLGDRENLVFMGTSVAAGNGRAVVVATAMNTELARIAGLIAEAGADERTPLEIKLESFGRVLVWAALGIVALLFGLGLLRGTKPFELFMTSVSLAVAAVPEGLPAVVTVSLALGVLRMSRRRALVRKPPAVEKLGSTTVICTDKTGTLTVGEMTVRSFYVAGQSYEVTGEGYLLTGRHGLFNCYEAFIHIIDSMFNQHAKWLKVTAHLPWRRKIASLNYLLASHVWRQDHSGFTHQDPGFIDHVVNKKAEIVRVYLPPDANCLLSVMDHCLRSRHYVNLVIAGKHPAPRWLTMDAAVKHCTEGIGIWPWVSNDQNASPDVVRACCGDVPTLETLAALSLMREHLPDLKIRVVNVVDLMKLQPQTEHPHGLNDREFDELFIKDKPVIFAFHAYPWLIHRLTYRRTNHDNIRVRGYKEEGTITTPFDMTVLNDLDRCHLVMDAIDRLPQSGDQGLYLKQQLKDKLVEHKQYIAEHGQDLPEIRNWKWGASSADQTTE